MNVWSLQNQEWHEQILKFSNRHTILKSNDSEQKVRLYSCTVTGGTFCGFLEHLHTEPNAAVLIDPCCHLFVLPCCSGCGEPHNIDEDGGEWQFSPELCCEWKCVDKNKVVLRDTCASLKRKIELARQMNISTILLTDRAHKMITASSN